MKNRWQFLAKVKNRYQILTDLKNQYQILTDVKNKYEIFTNVIDRPLQLLSISMIFSKMRQMCLDSPQQS